MEIREVEGSGGSIYVSDGGGVFAMNHPAFPPSAINRLTPLNPRINNGYLYIHIPALRWDDYNEAWFEGKGVDFAQMKRFSLGEPHFIHRLVCRTFHGESPAKHMVVDHINGVTTDNRAENLRWLTTGENMMLGRWRKRGCPHVFGLDISTGSITRFANWQVAEKAGYVPQQWYATRGRGKIALEPYDQYGSSPILAYVNNENLIEGYVSKACGGGISVVGNCEEMV